MKKRFVILDGSSLFFRAFFALPPLTSPTGEYTNAIFGFANMFLKLWEELKPDELVIAFDKSRHTFRTELYPEYKGTRDKTPDELKSQIPLLEEFSATLGVTFLEKDNYEADDIIGTLATQAAAAGYDASVVTGDRDALQLVRPNLRVLMTKKGISDLKEYDEAAFMEEYQMEPLKLIDLKGLMGDTADNIPGCPGVGPKTAEKLIQQYGSIENLLEHTGELKGNLKKKIEDNREQIVFSKFLATIKTDVPLDWDEEALRRVPVDYVALRKVFAELEFKTLTTRIIDHGEANVGLDGVPLPAAPAGSQPSLFGSEAPAPVEVTPAATIKSHEHDYRLIADLDEARAYVAGLMQGQGDIGLHIVAQGQEAMRAHILGFALCGERYHAAYLPLDDFGWMIDVVRPLLAGNRRLVSNDVKRDMVMLHAHGVAWSAPYYDTGVAHYLLQPERNHDTASIAATFVGYAAMSPDDYLGPKGRGQKQLSQLKPEKFSQVACELADLCLWLPPVLDRQLDHEGMTHLLTDIEQPLVEVLASMEMTGARVDVKALNDYSVKLTAQVERLEQECYDLAGEHFNTASPSQVGVILFDKLHLDDKAKKTKSGQYSTTEEILVRLRDRHPLVSKILELRGIRKLLSTYVNALPELINPRTGRIHTTYNQTVTATGRLSSTNPNLQNIPVRTDEGKEIRKAFIPSDGNVFFSADYSQIELRLVADFSHDATMLDAFKHGQDIHAITASKIYHEPLESVTPEQRRKAKTANFGILYGISAFGLAQRLDIPRSEAKELIDGYYATFPQVRAYIDRTVAQAKEKGYVTTLYGRRRMLPDINSRNAVVRQFSERNAVNAPIQGTAADVIKIAMVAIYRRFKVEGLKSKMILQVHDELNFDVVPGELETVQRIVVDEMENAYHGDVRLTASHGVAGNWLDAH